LVTKFAVKDNTIVMVTFVGMKSKEEEQVQCSSYYLWRFKINYIILKNVKIFRNYFLQNFKRKIGTFTCSRFTPAYLGTKRSALFTIWKNNGYGSRLIRKSRENDQLMLVVGYESIILFLPFSCILMGLWTTQHQVAASYMRWCI
jgi:hypothetical protein